MVIPTPPRFPYHHSRAQLESMKANAKYLCPRCFIAKGDVPEIGTDNDMKRRLTNPRKYPPNHIEIARKGLFESGWSIGYKGEHNILENGSWAPTRVGCSSFPLPDMILMLFQNAYHTELGLDPSEIQAVDLMHDVELGLKRNVILHLLRIFHAAGKDIVQIFDTRSVPLRAVVRSRFSPATAFARSQHLDAIPSGGLAEVFPH